MRNAALLLPLLALAACGDTERAGTWPSLAPRPGEVSPMVPRTPLGGCAGCGPELPGGAAELAPPPPPAPVPLPADAATRLAAIERAVADVAGGVAAPRRRAEQAIAAARGARPDSEAGIAAEVERSRYEAVFLPLGPQAEALEALEADIAGRDGAEALAARIAALKERFAALESARRSLP